MKIISTFGRYSISAAALCASLTSAAVEITPIAEPQTEIASCVGQECTLEAYADGLADAITQSDNMMGFSVSMVRKDRVLLSKGYGLAQLPDKAVDPERSLFRIGSVSKLFTYIAAHQLREQGKLDLQKPANDYLPDALKIPADGMQGVVRVQDLLQHTAGFEDIALGHLFVFHPRPVLTLEDYLAKHRPRRVREPGTAAVYSNYSVALLGAIVARVSGQRYEDYVEQHIFKPLQMTHSTFREPINTEGLRESLIGDPKSKASGTADARQIPKNLRPDISDGTNFSNGVFEANAFEYIGQIAPAGGMSSTASDMAKFAQTLLSDGTLGDAKILSAASLRAMQSNCYTNGKGAHAAADASTFELNVQPICNGFLTMDFRMPQRTVRGYGHGGATMFFHTAFMTIPELDIAVFVSTNTDEGRKPAAQMANKLLEHLHPEIKHTASTPYAVSKETVAEYAGSYLSERRAFFGLEGFLTSLSFQAVTPDTREDAPAGALLITGGAGIARYVPIGADVYQNSDTRTIAKFLRDADKKVYAYTAGEGISLAKKVSTTNSAMLPMGLMIFAGIVAIFSLISAVYSNSRGHRVGLRSVRGLSIGNALLTLIVLGLFGLTVAALSDPAAVFAYPSAAAKLFMYGLLLLALIAIVRAAFIARVWRSEWSRIAKAGYVFSVLVFLALTLTLWRFDLLTLRF
jgi:CubicO group peptidase (beta-lactamase class C family)